MVRARFQECFVVTLALCALLATGCRTSTPSSLSRYEFASAQMGVPFRIVLYTSDPVQATNASQAAFARVAELNQVLSDYEPESELSLLSRSAGQGRTVRVSDDLWRVLEPAQRLAARTEGAFDVTVGPTVLLWRKARRDRQFPDPHRLEAALKSVGYRNLKLNPRRRTAELLAPDMRLDLGGIAKGYAVDEALKTLRQFGITRALVSGGGDLAVSGPPPGKRGWRIELTSVDASAPPEFLLLANAALATSGDVFQFVELNGKRYSHIVDPRTGVGLTDQSLVNVVARDCMTADSFATAVSVLGRERGMALVTSTPGVEMRLVRRPAGGVETTESPGFRRFRTQ